VPRVKSYLGLRKAREQPESAVVLYIHVVYIHVCLKINYGCGGYM